MGRVELSVYFNEYNGSFETVTENRLAFIKKCGDIL